MDRATEDLIEEFEAVQDAPSTLSGILDPVDALAAARRMQSWYRSTPQGTAHSHFGRDGRKIDRRQMMDVLSSADSAE